MADFQRTTHIPRPADVVFNFMTDFDNASSWMPQITRIEPITEGPLRVGYRFNETRRIMNREASAEIELTDFEPGRRLRWTSAIKKTAFHYEYTIEPDGEDACNVTLKGWAEPGSFIGRLMAGPMVRMMERSDGDQLDRLAAAVTGDQ